MRFRCVAMPSEDAARFRRTRRDDRGQAVIERVASGEGEPCRHCLRLAEKGEAMLLLSWDLPRPLGTYWTPSPVFLHARDCAAYADEDALPQTVLANGLVSVRAYDGAGMCLYDLGHVGAGEAAEPWVARALGDPRTAFVNIHTARPGCWLCGAEVVAG